MDQRVRTRTVVWLEKAGASERATGCVCNFGWPVMTLRADASLKSCRKLRSSPIHTVSLSPTRRFLLRSVAQIFC